MEKNNIGRPSTYATIINKILERKYVEIKNIDGIKKNSKIIELDKKYKIKETEKEVIIGKENKKMIPTELGIKVSTFLENNFIDIMKVDFTSDFETYLDKISDGNAKWYNVLDIFYKKFNPIVEELNKVNLIKQNNDKFLGKNNDQELFIGKGKYGPYIKIIDKDNKTRYVSIPNEEIDLDDALELIKYPILLGKYNKKNIELHNGKYGLYIKYNNQNFSINNNIDITIDEAIEIIKSKENNEFIIKDLKVVVKNGKFGPYLELNGKNKQNIPIPKEIDIKNINIKIITEIISKKKNI